MPIEDTGATTSQQAQQYIFNGSVWVPAANALVGDGAGGATLPAEAMWAQTGTLLFSALRTPNVFRVISATAAGNTGLWAPAAGKKFRLMRYQMQITISATLGVAAELVIGLQDSAADLGLDHRCWVAAAAGTNPGFFETPWIDLGNGVLSAAANNVLNVNLSVALTAGLVRVIACGTEE